MRNHLIQIASALLMLSPCASSSQQAENVPDKRTPSVPFCEVLSNFKNYNEKRVLTTSLAGVAFHSIGLFDPACMSTEKENLSAELAPPDSWNSTEIGKKLEKIFRHKGTARITFEGTFCSDKWSYGPDGVRFRFVMQRLISVKEVPKKEFDTMNPATGNLRLTIPQATTTKPSR